LLRSAAKSLHKAEHVDRKRVVPAEVRAAIDATVPGILTDLTALETL
jgi:hypothetical protein